MKFNSYSPTFDIFKEEVFLPKDMVGVFNGKCFNLLSLNQEEITSKTKKQITDYYNGAKKTKKKVPLLNDIGLKKDGEYLQKGDSNDMFAPFDFGIDRDIAMAIAADKQLPRNIENISISGGSCLFSDQSLLGICPDGSKVPLANPKSPVDSTIIGIEFMSDPSFYELETSSRLTTVMKFLKNISDSNKVTCTDISLDIPKVEYYLYLMEAYKKGLIAPKVLLNYFNLIDLKSEEVCNLMTSQLPKNMKITRSGQLDVLESYIKTNVQNGVIPNISDMTNILQESDPLFAKVLEFSPPTSFVDITYKGYDTAYLRASTQSPDNSKLNIAVENPVESALFNMAGSIGKQISLKYPEYQFTKFALYPFPDTKICESTDAENWTYFFGKEPSPTAIQGFFANSVYTTLANIL